MSLLRGGGTARRWGRADWTVALLAAWLWPVVPGMALVLLVPVAGGLGLSQAMPMAVVAASATGMALLLSPVFSWVGIVFLAPLAAGLARAGWLGWLPSMGAGAVAGIAAASVLGGMSGELVAAMGAVSALMMRAALDLRTRRAGEPDVGTGPNES